MGSLCGVCDNPCGRPSVCQTTSHSLRVIRKSSGQDLLSSVCVCLCVSMPLSVCSACAQGGWGLTLYQAKVSTESFLHNSVSDNTGAFLSTHITAASIFALVFPTSQLKTACLTTLHELESISFPFWAIQREIVKVMCLKIQLALSWREGEIGLSARAEVMFLKR